MTHPHGLDLTSDVADLTAALVDVASVSGSEGPLADAIEAALRDLGHLEVVRDGAAVLARTHLDADRRVVLAGHLDTVPIAANVPSRRDGDVLYGCGTSDMKSGVAVMLALAAALRAPAYDLTWIFYDNEEVEAARNGLGRIARSNRHWLYADLAVLLEPTGGHLEAGCQGTMRATVTTTGRRAHTARSWLGINAIHEMLPALDMVAAVPPRKVEIDGCHYQEGLNAVAITGGVAANVIPDECTMTLNFRFAPDRTVADAEAFLRETFDDFDVSITDAAAGALPGLTEPAVADFVRAVGTPPRAKYGWTDVSRFAAFGIPAVNFGPGNPDLAHTRDEHVRIGDIRRCQQVLAAYLGAGEPA